MSEEIRGHWYCFTYTSDGGCIGSASAAYHKKHVTKQAIDENKKLAGMPMNSALTGLFYLGYMTLKEFKGGD